MTQKKGFKRALSLACVLCLMFSMLGSEAFAVSADEVETGETIAAQADVIEEETIPEVQTSETESAVEGSAEGSSNSENAEIAGADVAETTEDSSEEITDDNSDSTSVESDEQAEGEVPSEETIPVDETEDDSEGPSQAIDDTTWNSVPITGQSASNGITVSVSAPEGSFPEGTSVHITALSQGEATEKARAITDGTEAVAFDISFLDEEGTKIQPDNGKTVSVSFSIPACSIMTADENEDTTLKVYHITDNGTAELMKSVSGPDADSSANINVDAESFSVYMLLKESEVVSDSKSPALRAVQNGVITKIEAQTYNGSGPQGDTGQWDVFRLYAEFALPNGTVHAGDTTTITLQEELKFNQTSSFEIKDGNGNVVANAEINGGAKTITLTYTDYVENNSDITGNFYFYVQIDRDNVDEEEDIPVKVDVSGTVVIGNTIHFEGIGEPAGHYLSKSGWQVTQVSDRAIRYQLSVNTKGEAIQNLTITDKIATPGFTVLHDSIVITKGTWVAVHGDWQLQNQTDVTADYPATWNEDGSFTLNLGDISATDGFAIRYTAEASYDLVDGEVINNNAILSGTNIGSYTASANAYYYEAGGSAEGYVYTINIHKVGEDGASLAGAVFNVIRVANGSIVGTITTDASGQGSISGLLKDAYQLVEVTAPSGYLLMEDPVDVSPEDFGSDKTVLKTITNHPEKTSIDVSKVWDDADDQDGIRPASVTVKLFANGVDTGKTLVLTEAEGWNGAFKDLDVYQDGEAITYSVEEVGVTGYIGQPSGSPESGYTITNIHTPEVIDISGSKTWDDSNDQDGARPDEITIRLLAGGTEIDSVTVTEADDWSWSFTNLPKYESGTEIIYSITEDAVGGYTPDYNGYNVTNAHTPGKTSVTVSKAWSDADDQDGIRPQSITLKLLANDVDTGKTVELNAANNWTEAFTDLDEYQSGQKIVYKVEEVDVTGYTTVVTGDADTGYTITNTHEPEVIDINGSKTWDDNDDQDGARPESITIRLLAGGTEIDSVTVTEADDWSWSFTNLPKYENGGSEIVYSITEDAVSDYSTEYNGYDVTNTHTPGKTSVTVSKAWNDVDDRDGIRPQTITVKLLANDVDTGKTVELSAATNWTGAFTDLDEYQSGQKIVYTVEEVSVTGYRVTITGSAEKGYTITNTHDPEKTSISVKKIWEDQNNKEGNRPKSITIRLLADGKDTGKTLILNADSNWAGSFTELDLYRDGKKIVYTISEDAVSGYTTKIKGDADDGFTVTNTKTVTPPVTPTSRTDTPKTGDTTNILLYLLTMLISGSAIAILLVLARKRRSRG